MNCSCTLRADGWSARKIHTQTQHGTSKPSVTAFYLLYNSFCNLGRFCYCRVFHLSVLPSRRSQACAGIASRGHTPYQPNTQHLASTYCWKISARVRQLGWWFCQIWAVGSAGGFRSADLSRYRWAVYSYRTKGLYSCAYTAHIGLPGMARFSISNVDICFVHITTGLLDDQMSSRAQTSYDAGMRPTGTPERVHISVHIADKLANRKVPFWLYQIWTTEQAGQARIGCRARPTTHPPTTQAITNTYEGTVSAGVCNKFAS